MPLKFNRVESKLDVSLIKLWGWDKQGKVLIQNIDHQVSGRQKSLTG